ncbi:MAG: BatD family protein, partial [Planctomycetota bacterium]
MAPVLAALASLPFAAAQEKLVVSGPDPGVLRLGDAARAEIRIVDPQGTPREFRLPEVDGVRLRLFGPSQQMEQRYDGRTSTTKVTLSWTVELLPVREGTFVVPPFAIWTGTREQTTRELRLEVRKDLRGAELGYLDVVVEPRRVYVHEPIRVRFDAGVQHGLRLVQEQVPTNQGFVVYQDLEVQASWLDDFPAGERIELGQPTGDTAIVRQGNTLVRVGHADDHQRDGQRWQRFVFERAFLPTRSGKVQLAAPTLRYQVVRANARRDVFGLPRGGAGEQFYVFGKPVEIEVLPIPEAGRPTPYYGAVGRFTIEAALDRDRVRVGSSVKLTLTVRGQGNLEFLRLPPLDELPGFHKLGQAEARRDADKVAVTYDLVPLSVDVVQVPAIAWNFFDTTPGTEAFVAVSTVALPLSVQPLANGETLAPLPEAAPKPVTPGVDDIFDLPAFDGPPAVVTPVAGWMLWCAALGPWAVALLGAFVRRRAAAARA